jgi:hypothetical protein
MGYTDEHFEMSLSKRRRMTNEEALERLTISMGDGAALINIAENNKEVFDALMKRYFKGRTRRARARMLLLALISEHAHDFIPGKDATKWIEEFSLMWCVRINRTIQTNDNRESVAAKTKLKQN